VPEIKCPSCGWIGDSEPVFWVCVVEGEELLAPIKTQDLDSRPENYGWYGNYAQCPNCSENLSHPNRLFEVNPEYLIKEEIEEGSVIKAQEDPYKWRLTRRVLLEVESSPAAYIYLGSFSKDVKFNYLDFCFCIRRCLDSGLLSKTQENEVRLTWLGHDFLANASTEWEEVMQVVNKSTTVKDLAKMLENSAKKRYSIN